MTAGRRGRRCYEPGCHPSREAIRAPSRELPVRSPPQRPLAWRLPRTPLPRGVVTPQSRFPSPSTSLPSPTQPSPASRCAPSFTASARLPGLPGPRASSGPHLPCPGPHRRGRCITAARRPGTALQSRQRAPPCQSRAEPTSLASRLQLPAHAQRPRRPRTADRRMRLPAQKFCITQYFGT